jgi:hypothetical protein
VWVLRVVWVLWWVLSLRSSPLCAPLLSAFLSSLLSSPLLSALLSSLLSPPLLSLLYPYFSSNDTFRRYGIILD